MPAVMRVSLLAPSKKFARKLPQLGSVSMIEVQHFIDSLEASDATKSGDSGNRYFSGATSKSMGGG